MVFWILVWLLAGVLILVLSHFFGIQVFNTANKIYAEFDPAKEDETNVDKGGKENV